VIDGNGENTDSYNFALLNLSVATDITNSMGTGGIINSVNNHAYLLTNSATWTDASSQAQAKGGYLVTVNNAAENQFLVDTFGGSEYLLIGFNDATVEGNFQWVNGEPVTYTNWYSGQPNNYQGVEDYAHLNFGSPGRWNDLSGTSVYRGIIEINNPSGVIPATEISGTLDVGQSTKVYQIAGKAGQTLRFTPSLAPADTNWILYNSANQIVMNTSANIAQTITLSSTGPYFLAIRGFNNSSVDYRFKIHELNSGNSSASNDTPLILGAIVNGTINTAGQVHNYSFTGSVGQQLFYDGLGADYLRLRFYDPIGREIYSADSRYDRGTNDGLVLGMNGTYRVTLSEGTGNYKFRLLDKANATVVNLDTDITGTFDNGGIE